LLAVEFPAVKGLKKYRLQLACEIAWHQPASLQLKTTACREPSYQTEILSDSIGLAIGLQVWPRIVLPDAPDDEEDEVFLPVQRLSRRIRKTDQTACRLSPSFA
jgi:hypothetical protein